MYLFLILFQNIFVILAHAANLTDNSFNANISQPPITNNHDDSFYSLNPFMDLAKVFNIVPILENFSLKGNQRHPTLTETPEYLYKLYKSLATSNGEGIGETPYKADTIYGHLLENNYSKNQRQFKYQFDNEILNNSKVLQSELHLYRLPMRQSQLVRKKRSIRFLIIKLYMITNAARKNTAFGNRLIDMQRIPINKYGWLVFDSSRAVKYWIERSNMTINHGFYLSIQNTDGSYVNDGNVVFVKPHMRHRQRLQPLVSVYTRDLKEIKRTDDELTETELSQAFLNNDLNRFNRIYNGDFYVAPKVRVKRSTYDSTNMRYCSLQSMNVEFEQMGWNQWIIGPRSFDAGICRGPCPYPIGQSYHPTNHAVVQSIWYHLNQGAQVATGGAELPTRSGIEPVCCVPHKLKPLRMLYYSSDKVVQIKTYDNMMVKSCGCK